MTALNLELHLRIVGVCLLLLVILNTLLPKRFGWREELAKISLLTRQIFVVHCMFIMLVVLMMAVVTLFFTPLLLDGSPLARLVLAGLAIFWTVRLGAQWFIYSPKLWRGHRFNTAMHILFSCLWAYFSLTFSTACYFSMR